MWMYVWVGLGGAIGAIVRYSIGLLFAGQTFPWATLTINVAGYLWKNFLSKKCQKFMMD